MALSSWTFEIPYACCLVLIVGMLSATAAAASELPVAGLQPESSGLQASDGGRAGSGQRVTIQSAPLENLLLKRGVITQDDWVRLKAEEERRVFEQSAEMQMAGNPRWYERIRINGYGQFRYNLGASDGKFDLPLNDSFGDQQGNEFFVRRLRLVLQGQVSERIAFFTQFALEGGQQQLSNREIIDAYMDYYLTTDRVHRVRLGLHRVPNAFDTYRSSTNRQELDRHESIQSGAPGERDLGIAYYWKPKDRAGTVRRAGCLSQWSGRLRCVRDHGLQRSGSKP